MSTLWPSQSLHTACVSVIHAYNIPGHPSSHYLVALAFGMAFVWKSNTSFY